MQKIIKDDTPIAMLTVGGLKEVLAPLFGTGSHVEKERKYVYGLNGLAKTFSCSIPTALRLKQSGKIDAAITQVGRKIIVDVALALELAGKKEKGGSS